MRQALIMEAPDGMELGFTVYLTSPGTGMNVAIVVSGLTAMGVVEPDVPALAKAGGLDQLADDWQLMTREEIREYKDQEAEE